MRVPAGLIATAFLVPFAPCQACADAKVNAPSSPTTSDHSKSRCEPGAKCVITGLATVVHRTGTYSWASISVGDHCIPLLLPDNYYRQSRRWTGRLLRVTGTALPRGPAPTSEVLQVQYRDRWLFPIICGQSDVVLYADTLQRLR